MQNLHWLYRFWAQREKGEVRKDVPAKYMNNDHRICVLFGFIFEKYKNDCDVHCNVALWDEVHCFKVICHVIDRSQLPDWLISWQIWSLNIFLLINWSIDQLTNFMIFIWFIDQLSVWLLDHWSPYHLINNSLG